MDRCASRSWLGGTLGEAYYRGWITAVPKGSIILLDLMSEEEPLFEKEFIKNYYGAPFIWCMLNDFGGNNVRHCIVRVSRWCMVV